jgi:hypothetical protein
MYHQIENNDPSVGGSLLWSYTPANSMISSHEGTEELKLLRTRNSKLASRLESSGAQQHEHLCPSDIWKASREGNLEHLLYLLEVFTHTVTYFRTDNSIRFYYFDRVLMPMLKFMLLVLFQIGATNSGESNSMEWYNCNASCCRGRAYAYYSMLAGSWSRCEREIISWMVFI